MNTQYPGLDFKYKARFHTPSLHACTNFLNGSWSSNLKTLYYRAFPSFCNFERVNRGYTWAIELTQTVAHFEWAPLHMHMDGWPFKKLQELGEARPVHSQMNQIWLHIRTDMAIHSVSDIWGTSMIQICCYLSDSNSKIPICYALWFSSVNSCRAYLPRTLLDMTSWSSVSCHMYASLVGKKAKWEASSLLFFGFFNCAI